MVQSLKPSNKRNTSVKHFLSDDKPLRYLITEGRLSNKTYATESQKVFTIIERAVTAKISLIQLREKNLSAKLIVDLASNAVKIAKNSRTKILINDRIDIALAVNADGIHLTSKSMPTQKTREIVPKSFLIGVSTHSLKTALEAKKQGADFVTFSPVFPMASKVKYGEPQGLDKLRQVCEKLESFPVIALGGIDKTNYKSVLENGAKGFASIRFLNDLRILGKL